MLKFKLLEDLYKDDRGQTIIHLDQALFRGKIPGGWLVVMRKPAGGELGGVTFVPDENHIWDGSSLD